MPFKLIKIDVFLSKKDKIDESKKIWYRNCFALIIISNINLVI